METLKERLKDHEGFRAEPYRDDRGNWTIGYGHFLGTGGCKISQQVGELILEEDIHKKTFEYMSLGWDLDPIRQDIMVEMIFWHGFRGFLKFKKMIAAIEQQDWQKAADEMLDSNSGRKYQTRMTVLASLMIKGDKL